MAIIIAAAAVSIGYDQQARSAPVKDRLVGTWKLVKWEVFDANGGPTRPGAYDVGRVNYDAAGQMSAHLMNSANKSGTTPATDADRAAAYRRYLGYFGSFTVDEARGIVIHHVVGSSNPTFPGTDQIRYFNLSTDGDTLTLSLKNGDRVTQTLTWERVR